MATTNLNSSSPKTIVDYLDKNLGVQNTNRFHVTISRPGQTLSTDFFCDLAQLPSKKIKAYSDMLSGSASANPVQYGVEYGSNLFQFVLEESWVSRTYFENWMSEMFTTTNGGWFSSSQGNTSVAPYENNKVKFFDDVAGTIQIDALSVASDQGIPIVNATYIMRGCIPVQIVPTNFDDKQLNSAVRFQVNIAYRYYQYTSLYKGS
jgi:hypothetical protein